LTNSSLKHKGVEHVNVGSRVKFLCASRSLKVEVSCKRRCHLVVTRWIASSGYFLIVIQTKRSWIWVRLTILWDRLLSL